MKFATGVMVAPRPHRTVEITLSGLRANGLQPVCFMEPGISAIPNVECVLRPARRAAEGPFLPEHLSPEGRFGNFQNYIQMMADLLVMFPDADALLLCEDDARICKNVIPFLKTALWPHAKCGAVSLYAPSMFTYGSPFPMCKHIVRKNTVGALATVFRPEVARKMLECAVTKWWKGDKHQQSGVAPWERRGCDAWIGNCMYYLDFGVYCFTPSLVDHYCPPESNGANSSLGNGVAKGPRTALNYIGDDADPFKVFKAWLDIRLS